MGGYRNLSAREAESRTRTVTIRRTVQLEALWESEQEQGAIKSIGQVRVQISNISNLPYRRFSIGRLSDKLIPLLLADAQQNKFVTARYNRLELKNRRKRSGGERD
jgi:hypothetical protein